MKQQIYFTFLVFMLTGMAFGSYGQAQKTQKPGNSTEVQQQKLQQNFYRRTLQVDSAKAEQVSKVQDSYKASMKVVEADTTLNETSRRAKIRMLMEQKNQQLRQLLSPAQQRKIIPTTELEPAKAAKQPK